LGDDPVDNAEEKESRRRLRTKRCPIRRGHQL